MIAAGNHVGYWDELIGHLQVRTSVADTGTFCICLGIAVVGVHHGITGKVD